MKYTHIKDSFLKITLFALSVVPLPILAATTGTGTGTGTTGNCNQCGTGANAGTICNPINLCNLPDLIKTILTAAIKIGIPVIALAIVYSGFLFVSARGNPKELETAKKSLMYTLIGAAVLLGSWAIAKLISDTVLAL